jgi:hypothetical protein
MMSFVGTPIFSTASTFDPSVFAHLLYLIDCLLASGLELLPPHPFSMAFSGDKSPFGDKKVLIKNIQTINQHLPGKRLPLTELLSMEKPGIKGKDNTFFILS